VATKDGRALLARLLKEGGERTWLEFKHNNCDPQEIGKYISAASNGALLAGKERAFLVFGIDDKTHKRIGTDVRLHAQKKGGENLDNWLSRLIEPRLQIEFLDFEDDGKHFSILCVEQAHDRPVRFEGQEYIRIGQNIRQLKDFPDHERALWLATSKHKFEGGIALTNQTGNQVLEKLVVSAYYNLTREPQPANAEVLNRFLSAGLIKEDLEGGYHITNLGAILLARSIRDFPSISSKSVRVIRYKGSDKRNSTDENEGMRGYAVGFSGLLRFVMQHTPNLDRYKKGVRISGPAIPETPVREVISNALIHQDFTISGTGPVIEIYDDRIEVTSPGGSLIAPDRIIDERQSRNERLAALMRVLGLCEERGGGIDKTILELEEFSLPAPEYNSSAHSVRVVLFGPRKFSQLSKKERMWSCFCHCVVRWLRHDFMNNTSLRERFSLDSSEYQAVSAVISDSRKAGQIIPAEKGQGKRNAKYIPYWASEK
jgi:ATP-dependent DNA helicase RecG